VSLVPKAPGEPFDYGETLPDGQHEHYPVLSEEERARGFVRPVFRAYRHVGLRGVICGLKSPTNADGTPVPAGRVRACSGRVGHQHEHFQSWYDLTEAEWAKKMDGCGATTQMGLALCETYARDPHYYGATFCVGCHTHLPVGEAGEFVWVDGLGVDTNLRVGQ
jgi:hypothetical protein